MLPTSTAIMLTNCRPLQKKKRKKSLYLGGAVRHLSSTFLFLSSLFLFSGRSTKGNRCHQLAAAQGCFRFVLQEVRREGTLHLFVVVPPRRTKDTRQLTNCFFFPNVTLQNHTISCEQSVREQGRTSSLNHLNTFFF